MKKSTAQTPGSPDPNVDPRIERSRLVIRQAALEELGERGYGSFSIESVAARAGVGKSTIYRHWPSKTALIVDAFETLNDQGGADIGNLPPRERVERIVRHVAEIVVDSTFSTSIPVLIDAAEREAEVRKFHHRFCGERRGKLVTAIADGISTGEFSDSLDPELAAIMLVGPIFYRRLMSEQPLSPDQVPALLAAVLGDWPKNDTE